MGDSDSQQRLVLWGYIIQWATLLMPLALVVSLFYALITRSRVTNAGLRSHLDWQLATVGIVVLVAVVAAILFFVGLSGVNTDAPVSIVATFMVVGLVTALPLWLLYRLVRGTLQFSKKLPMQSLFL